MATAVICLSEYLQNLGAVALVRWNRILRNFDVPNSDGRIKSRY